MEKKIWQKTVGSLIGAIWLYTLANIAGSITDFVDDLLNPVDLFSTIASLAGGGEGSSPFGTIDLLGYFFSLSVIVGYFLFFSALSRFIELQRSDSDIIAVKRIRKAYILMFVSVLLGFIPLIGTFVAFIITIVAYASLLSGYKSLRDSSTFTAEARQGAARLRTATIWLLVGYIIGALPFCGIIESLISSIAFFSILSGWNCIRKGAPELSEEEISGLIQSIPNIAGTKSVIPVWWIPAYVGTSLVLGICLFGFYLFGWLTDKDTYIERQYIFEGIMIAEITPWLILVYRVLIITGCCFLLFYKKVYLNFISKVGILLLMTSFFITLLVNFFYLQIYNIFPYTRYVYMALAAIQSVGIMLFVWNIMCDNITKIAFTVWYLLDIIVYYLLYSFIDIFSPNELVTFEQKINFIGLLDNSFILVNCSICFTIVLIRAIQQSKKKLTLTN